MKKYTFLLFFLISGFFYSAFAQSGGKFAKWPEIKAYHAVMSQTFHPSETGNLEPIKKQSKDLLAKADALAKSVVPQEFSNKDVTAAVAKLAKDSKALDDLVQAKAKDEEITKALSGLHDTFHTIVEKCSPENHHHDDHSGHDHK